MLGKQTTGDSEGVSPVIGVILMVAITVILAAVIATFVLNLSGNLQQGAQASVTFDEDAANSNVDVRLVNVQNADFVELRANGETADEVEFESSNDVGGANSGDAHYDLEAVGNSATMDYDADDDDTATSGTITTVGYLEGEGSTLQTFEFGG